MIPLSFAQRRLWFLWQLEGDSATYNVPVTLRLTGPVDAAALRQAMTDVAARHEVLRTVFPSVGGYPFQQVLDAGQHPVSMPVTDVTEAALPDRIAGLAAEGFDLARETPWRAQLLRLGPDDHVLLILLHHIAADGWSLAPLARDISAAYTARRAGRAPGWEPLPVQ